jgi:hypothetical protein
MLPNASWTVLEPLVETGGPHPKVRSSNTRRTIRAVLSRQENCIQWRSRCGRMARDSSGNAHKALTSAKPVCPAGATIQRWPSASRPKSRPGGRRGGKFFSSAADLASEREYRRQQITGQAFRDSFTLNVELTGRLDSRCAFQVTDVAH